ncbi:MAG: protease modulator HflK [Planctomycetaceae bacterium]
MRRSIPALICLLVAYFATGFFVIQGNEKGLVRRWGKAQTNGDGEPNLLAGGLHYDLPWPIARVDRVNLNEVRTLTLGSIELDSSEGGGFLRSLNSIEQAQFLTGDKNILNVQIGVQYRVSEKKVLDYLYHSQSPERHLALLAESTAADLIASSGVDFVHPLGLGELRERLTSRVRQLSVEHRLGIEIDEVAVNAVYPPVLVKAYFLDVSNARADKENYIQTARAFAEQKLAASQAEQKQIIDSAESYRREIVDLAEGEAESFTRLVAELKRQEAEGLHTYAEARQMALKRRYLDTMEEVLGKVAGKVFLDSGQPVDLTILKNPKD